MQISSLNDTVSSISHILHTIEDISIHYVFFYICVHINLFHFIISKRKFQEMEFPYPIHIGEVPPSQRITGISNTDAFESEVIQW